MKLFIFILLSFWFLNSGLVYASNCFKPNPVKKDLEKADKEVSVASNKQIQKPIPKHVLKKAQKSVWKISSFSGRGTGFFISPNELVTNFHVVANILKRNSNNFTLSQKDNHKTLKVKKVKHLSAQFDLVVLEIKGEVSDYLNLAEKDPEPKENLSLIGYPNGKFKIVDKTSDTFYENEFEYTYFVRHGDYRGASGSPVLNSKGEVIGIAHSSSRGQMSVVKIIHLQNLLKQDSPSFQHPSDHLKHSIKELRQVAESGDMFAQFKLGVMYYEGQGVEQDFKEAARWTQKAAEQGHVEAQFNLGFAYRRGLGVEEDLKEAVYWYRKAAEQGLAEAQFKLGVLYKNGEGVEQDFKEAARWYRAAAEQGLASAQINLGFAYAKGLGVEQDPEEANYWYRKAAEQGDELAQFNLSLLYASGLGVKKDLEEAARWLRKAAEQGLARAQFKLDLLHTLGKDMKKDPEEAVRWTQKTVEQEHAEAQKEL